MKSGEKKKASPANRGSSDSGIVKEIEGISGMFSKIPRFPTKNVEHIKSYSRRRRRRPGRRRPSYGYFCFHVGVTTTRRPNKREYFGLDRLFTTTSESQIIRKNAGITRIPAFFFVVAGGRFELPTFGL